MAAIATVHELLSGSVDEEVDMDEAVSRLLPTMVDVAAGEKIPRKGGPGITKSDLFVINKTDLAPHVGADLTVMEADSRQFRGDKAFCFTNLKTDEGLEHVIEWLRHDVLMQDLA